MDNRLSKIETIVERIETQLNDRLGTLEARDNERKGAWWTIIAIATALGTVAGTILTHFWR